MSESLATPAESVPDKKTQAKVEATFSGDSGLSSQAHHRHLVATLETEYLKKRTRPKNREQGENEFK